MVQYSYIKQVSSIRLMSEIQLVGLSSINHIDTYGTTVLIFFDSALTSPQKTALDTVVSNHVNETTREVIDQIIGDAMAFGNSIVKDFIVENVMLGITRLGLTGHVRKMLREVKDAVLSGSLYDAISEIKNLSVSDFDSTIITPARILIFRNKIETYLKITLSTRWDE